MYVFTKNRFGDYVLTREARLAPGARCYNTSVQRQGYSSSVQQQEYNWSKKSVCAASIDKNAPAN